MWPNTLGSLFSRPKVASMRYIKEDKARSEHYVSWLLRVILIALYPQTNNYRVTSTFPMHCNMSFAPPRAIKSRRSISALRLKLYFSKCRLHCQYDPPVCHVDVINKEAALIDVDQCTNDTSCPNSTTENVPPVIRSLSDVKSPNAQLAATPLENRCFPVGAAYSMERQERQLSISESSTRLGSGSDHESSEEEESFQYLCSLISVSTTPMPVTVEPTSEPSESEPQTPSVPQLRRKKASSRLGQHPALSAGSRIMQKASPRYTICPPRYTRKAISIRPEVRF